MQMSPLVKVVKVGEQIKNTYDEKSNFARDRSNS